MNQTKTLIWALFTLFTFTASAQNKYSKVKIHIASPQDRSAIIKSLQLDHFLTEGSSIICEIGQSEIKKLESSSYKYEILVDDVVQDLNYLNREFDHSKKNGVLDNQSASRMAFDVPCKTVADLIAKPAAFATDGAMGGYYNFTEMVAAMDNLVAAYPAFVQKFSLGKSFENRDIWCIKISDNVATDESEPEVFYSGLQHAREAITGTSLIFFMQYLAENYASDTKVQSIINNREIFIVPCVNPDGYVQNQTSNPSGGGMWRKNKTGVDGTDLNRNYNVDWARSGGGSSDPYNDTYWGTAAFSEPETQAMRAFITSRNFVIAIDQHCFGPYYSLPFGFSTPYTLSTEDLNFYSYIPALMGKYNCHRAGNSVQTVGYEVAGGIKDYFVLGDIGVGSKSKVLGMTGEAGGGGFWAPKAQIISLSQGLCFQNLQLATAAGSYADLQDVTDMDVSATSGSFSYLLRRVGVGSDPVTVTMLPIQNIQTTGAPVVTSLNNYYDTYTGSISYMLPASITNGERIRFAWKVETGGITTYDTIVKFYNPNLLLNDNMEGALSDNWSVPSGGNASNKWGFVTGTSYGGTKSLTESMSGNYPASATRYVDYKNTFNLTNTTAAYLSFWVKHRAENCNDKLQVQISTNGSTYTPVCGINTISESSGTLAGKAALTGIRENWTKEVFDLSNYLGSANVYLRFEFTSNTDAAADDFYAKVDDGFYIDNVKVLKSSASLSTLPVTFIKFEGKLLNDNTVRLNWEAYTDQQHDFFEVQRSSDGSNFAAIGRGNAFPPFHFLDKQPKSGGNFYRIKQVDKDGQITYSSVINISILNNTNVTVFPNPITDNVSVNIKSLAPQNYILQITDIQGKVMYNKAIELQNTNRELNIDMKSWNSQTYILKVSMPDGRTLITQKLIKL